MTGLALRREIRKRYNEAEGVRFFTEKALLFALLEKRGLPRDHLIRTGGEELTPELSGAILADADSLLAGEPLQYYLGEAEFCGCSFFAEPGVLIPREDTEVLVREAARVLPEGAFFFDFCCGSGCVGAALALLRPDLSGTLFDLSEKALALTERNLTRHGLGKRLTARLLDVLSPAAEEAIRAARPALVTANPPYLTAGEMDELPENVRREPRLALLGGEDGLLFYRRFAALCRATGAPFLTEIGSSQAAAVFGILRGEGLTGELFRDGAGRDRAVLFRPA